MTTDLELPTPPGMPPALFARLREEAEARARGSEPAHDFFHVLRVCHNARLLARAEDADESVVVTAALLHELFTLPKGHPDSSRAGDTCAVHARELLTRVGADAAFSERVALAIRDHAFSKGVTPESLEAKLLQDADRLDALGAIGLARMWATCADMKRPFYSPDDPFCEAREPDDKSWGLDHVYTKLLRLPDRLHSGEARRIAASRVAVMQEFLRALRREIGA